MRMVIFAIILVLVMIFARQGIMGRKEFSWQGLFHLKSKIKLQKPK
jgi:branched-chain amino acid transport system permease protein